MLALTRKKNQAIVIDGNIEITVLEIKGDKVKLGISAPCDKTIYRKEVYVQMSKVNQEAVQKSTIDLQELNNILGI
ncbi:MAG: carbon storage regulator CsrA [Cellulosilyticum sp.]|nr:carbon storage regulator CsrA [Cellulosilyticum sp.]